jgi:hypothetical protein
MILECPCQHFDPTTLLRNSVVHIAGRVVQMFVNIARLQKRLPRRLPQSCFCTLANDALENSSE